MLHFFDEKRWVVTGNRWPRTGGFGVAVFGVVLYFMSKALH